MHSRVHSRHGFLSFDARYVFDGPWTACQNCLLQKMRRPRQVLPSRPVQKCVVRGFSAGSWRSLLICSYQRGVLFVSGCKLRQTFFCMASEAGAMGPGMFRRRAVLHYLWLFHLEDYGNASQSWRGPSVSFLALRCRWNPRLSGFADGLIGEIEPQGIIFHAAISASWDPRMLGVGSPILCALLSIVVQELLIGELGMQELLVTCRFRLGCSSFGP